MNKVGILEEKWTFLKMSVIQKYLLTLKIDDKKKAEKIMNSIPANLKKEQKA